MKFNLNPALKTKIEELLDKNELSLSISDMFSYSLENRFSIDPKEVQILKEKYHASSIDIFKDKLLEFLELDENEDEAIDRYFLSSISYADINKYLSNPYYQNIKIKDVKSNQYELVKDHYLPYELFPYKDMGIESNSFIELNSMSFFEKEFSFISLNHKGETWMSITPNEIETMDKSIDNAHGRVVVYGLGLGYYPYMVSLKESVKKITIIDNDKNIIKLFKDYILPQFKHKDKIHIVESDAFSYMKEKDDFDYAFIDLWHNPLDGIEAYLKCKKLEKENKEYSYWIESSLIALLRRCMFTLIKEQLDKYKDKEYLKADSITDQIINQYYFKTKNIVISSIEELYDILSDKSLINHLI